MAWLGTWAYRIRITIDNTDILTALAGFPILVHLSASSGISNSDLTAIFAEIGANRLRMAFALENETQCYAEIEDWNWTGVPATSEAWVWVRIPNISHVAPSSYLYIYYDNAQPNNVAWVGDKESVPGMAVWDDDFVMTQHLDETGGNGTLRKDSTDGNNDVTMVDIEDPTAAGIADTADDYEKAQTDYGHRQNVQGTELEQLTFTCEAWVNIESVDATQTRIMLEKRRRGQSDFYLNYALAVLRTVSPQNFRFVFGDGVGAAWVDSTTLPNLGEWYYVVGTFNNVTKDMIIYVGRVSTGVFGLERNQNKAGQIPYVAGTQDLNFGYRQVTNNCYMDGIMDEIRISKNVRNISWLQATFETTRDDLLTYGAVEPYVPPVIPCAVHAAQAVCEANGCYWCPDLTPPCQATPCPLPPPPPPPPPPTEVQYRVLVKYKEKYGRVVEETLVGTKAEVETLLAYLLTSKDAHSVRIQGFWRG